MNLVPIITCMVCWVCGLYVGKIINTLCLNSRVYFPTTDGVNPVKFSIIKIEEAFDTKGNSIAKYTVDVHFFAKENCKDWKYNKLYFYDDVNKYKLGDILTFDRMN